MERIDNFQFEEEFYLEDILNNYNGNSKFIKQIKEFHATLPYTPWIDSEEERDWLINYTDLKNKIWYEVNCSQLNFIWSVFQLLHAVATPLTKGIEDLVEYGIQTLEKSIKNRQKIDDVESKILKGIENRGKIVEKLPKVKKNPERGYTGVIAAIDGRLDSKGRIEKPHDWFYNDSNKIVKNLLEGYEKLKIILPDINSIVYLSKDDLKVKVPSHDIYNRIF